MGLDNIEKKSLGYSLLWNTMRAWHNIVYYRKYTVIGTENIPNDKLLIFTPNHQNALMDALALLFSTKIQFVFLARADIFKKPAIARILYFLKILPIYRVRDGYDSVEKSNKVFERTVDIMTAGSAMVILPEGNHSRIRRLRPLKKGFARMAFKTQEANDFKLDIQVVPVGIDYDDFSKYRSSLVIKFGTPVSVLDFVDLYQENKAQALNDIKEELSRNMAPLIPNIRSEEYYDLYNELRVIFRSRMAAKLAIDYKDERNRVKTDQHTIQKIADFEKKSPNEITVLSEKVASYTQLKKSLGLTNSIIDKKGHCFFSVLLGTISLLGTLPLFVYGLIVNIIPYSLPIFAGNKMPDEQFRSSVKFVLSALLFPIMYILQSLIVLGVTRDWATTGIFLLSLPLSGIISWRWTRIYLWVKDSWTYKLMSISKNRKLTKLRSLYDDIILKADKITA